MDVRIVNIEEGLQLIIPPFGSPSFRHVPPSTQTGRPQLPTSKVNTVTLTAVAFATIHLVALFACLLLVFRAPGWKSSRPLKRCVIVGSVIVAICSMVFLAKVLWADMIEAVYFLEGPREVWHFNRALRYYARECLLQNTAVLFTKFHVIFGCWVVWRSLRLVIFPFILWSACVACVYLQQYYQMAGIGNNPGTGPRYWGNVNIVIPASSWIMLAIVDGYVTYCLMRALYFGLEEIPKQGDIARSQIRWLLGIINRQALFSYAGYAGYEFWAWSSSRNVVAKILGMIHVAPVISFLTLFVLRYVSGDLKALTEKTPDIQEDIESFKGTH
ncbi:hypothetical protein NP233_g9172 [Leucocoprinus birnbaumii]|uniref:Uncharacterized protein n=1 Tax=Leucocoprinus birnbaumii TaxID=56174 RepID=A0AAD5YT31_9AGAR|nr:hypothetical protein NP233_g9172 [Leucocoprinus birnbaumii]